MDVRRKHDRPLRIIVSSRNAVSWGWTNPDPSASLIFSVDGAHFYGLAAGTASFTLYGIPYGSYGCMEIAAYNAFGASAYTPYSCSFVVPIAPYSPHQSAATTTTATIAWNLFDPFSYLEVYDYATASFHTLPPNTTSYTLSGITPPGSSHCLAVTAFNASYSAPYAYACGYTPPNAPTNIHATTISPTAVTFVWTAPDPNAWYYVYDPTSPHVTTGTTYTTTNIIVSGVHGYACVYVAAANTGGPRRTPMPVPGHTERLGKR